MKSQLNVFSDIIECLLKWQTSRDIKSSTAFKLGDLVTGKNYVIQKEKRVEKKEAR